MSSFSPWAVFTCGDIGVFLLCLHWRPVKLNNPTAKAGISPFSRAAPLWFGGWGGALSGKEFDWAFGGRWSINLYCKCWFKPWVGEIPWTNRHQILASFYTVPTQFKCKKALSEYKYFVLGLFDSDSALQIKPWPGIIGWSCVSMFLIYIRISADKS